MKSHAHTRVLLLALLLAVGLHAFPQSVTPPRFPGGDTGFAGFLFSHLRYPEAMLDSLPHVEGRVLVRITIDTDGYVSRAGIVQSLGYHFDTAALRVVSKMPQWEPARDSLGHPLPMSSTIPIPFFAPKPKSEEEPVPPELVGVSRDPMFPGGEYVMQTFVKDRLAEWPEAKGCGKVTVYFAVNKTYACAGNRAVPRDVGHRYRCGYADSRGNFGLAVGVHRHNGGNYRAVVSHVFREERTNRSVNTAGG